MMMHKPSRLEIANAFNKTLRDVIGPNLEVLFCGINPGLYSAAVGHNFARPGNRFWASIFGAGFTDHLLVPAQERDLLHYGYGITNIVKRATSKAEELTREELREGGEQLTARVLRYKPLYLAIVGITAYRNAFSEPKAQFGLQKKRIGKTVCWVLPNTSGLNAHHQLPELIRHFSELRAFIQTNKTRVHAGSLD